MADVLLEHVGCGCNRVANALHWCGDDGGLVAYASHNAVVIYDAEEARICTTLLGHTSRVNCVRWFCGAHLGLPVHQPLPAALLASGSSDATIRLWLCQPGNTKQLWHPAAQLIGHAAPVTSLTAFGLGSGSLLLVSTAAGAGEVLVWECSFGTGGPFAAAQQEAWRVRQRINLGHRMQDCAALASLLADPGWLVLALGGVDSQVRLFTCPPGGQFEEACSLAGHQDWVRGLAFAQMDDGRLLLASASQDKTVRIWAIVQEGQQGSSGSGSSSVSVQSSLGKTPLAASLLRYAPKPRLWTQQHCYAAILESLLVGHEDWVHSVAWQPAVVRSDGSRSQPACLLSAGMDRTMMIWRPDTTTGTGLWMAEESVGDAGTNHLGYFTGVWNQDGTAILAHGYTGALHLWRRQQQDQHEGEEGAAHRSSSSSSPPGDWVPHHALGGHYGPIVDACWAADGSCLLTVATDQTARLTTCMRVQASSGGSKLHWCEIARPQVHGHDFSCSAAIPVVPASQWHHQLQTNGTHEAVACKQQQQQQHNQQQAAPAAARFLYASGSEEKVIRVFEGPQAFADTLALAQGRKASSAGSSGNIAPSTSGAAAAEVAALGAMLPALGLSQKAVYQDDEGSEAGAAAGQELEGVGGYTMGPDLAPQALPSAVAGPPLEEHLAQNTLWPEIRKLYGHGNDVYCMAADPQGQYLASACRAQTADAAAIWIWETERWMGVASLPAHSLTVTQLAFSPDGALLASASRDRSIALFQRHDHHQQQQQQQGESSSRQQQQGEQPPFRLVGKLPKAHARIVWTLDWSPDGRMLATGSRDATVKLWPISSVTGDASLPAAPAAVLTLADSVRSVAFAPDCQPGASYCLAVGLENGSVQLLCLACSCSSSGADGQADQPVIESRQLWHTTPSSQHAAAVRRLCWRRVFADEADQAEGLQAPDYHLASVGEDHAIRIFSVRLSPET